VAALSLKGHQDTASFIQAFAGSNRYIMDYLVEEVLQQQPESIQTFLLQTAILDRLTGALCDAVCFDETAITGQDDGQATLEMLERANLFIVPLDDERRWYRYHRLFADLLRARLKQTQPDWIPELHRRAAEWCGKNGLIAEAIGHALAAGDFEQAARLIEQIAPQTLWRHGEVITFLGWLEALPEELIRTRPRLGLYHAWALLTIVRLNGVEQRLQDVERALSETEKNALLSEVIVIRAMMANFRGDRSRAIELCNQALGIIPQDNLFLHTTILGNLGGAYAESGDVVAAGRAFAEASRLSLVSGDNFAALIALCFLADAQATQGQLHQAAQTYHRALELVAEQGGEQLPLAGLAYVGLSDLLREWNDLDEAMRLLTKGIKLGEQQGDVIVGPGLQILTDGYLGLARVYQAQGNVDGALEAIRKAELVAHKHNPSQVGRVAAAQARLWIVQGNLTAATQWMEECGLGAEDEPNHLREFEHLTLARVLTAQDKSVAALGLLEQLLQAAKTAKRTKSEIEILTLKALSFQAQGETAQAMLALEQTLSLAEPEGYVCTFVDEGAPMEKLVHRASSRGILPEYVKKLLTAFGVSCQPQPPVAQSLIDPLSERELEVLRLVADGLSNREIAEELVIAVTTAKKHVSNIFGKLDVSSRTQAVARSRELGLM
jgi:LuxR family maltose regulon positive regulatory protein